MVRKCLYDVYQTLVGDPLYVKSQTDTRLELAGIPGRRIWMIAICAFGVLATAGAVWFMWMASRESDSGWSWSFLPLSFGVLIGQGFFWIGAITLAVGRMSLVLDNTSGTGDYDVRSPVIEVGKPCHFKLANVNSVALEATSEWRPGHGDGPETTAKVLRAKLRITKPRRSIVLDETENGRVERVEKVAAAVANFLDKPLQRD